MDSLSSLFVKDNEKLSKFSIFVQISIFFFNKEIPYQEPQYHLIIFMKETFLSLRIYFIWMYGLKIAAKELQEFFKMSFV